MNQVRRVLMVFAALASLLLAVGCATPSLELAQAAEAITDGRVDQASALFDSYLKRQNGSLEAYLDVTQVCMLRGAHRLCTGYAERGLAQNAGGATSARAGLERTRGSAYLQLALPGEAAKAFQTALTLEPNDPTTKNNLGYALAEDAASPADLDRALGLVNEALQAIAGQPETYGDETTGVFLDSLGWIYYRQRLYQKSMSVLMRAAGLAPGEGDIAFHAALACEGCGRLDTAFIMAQRAANAAPRDARFSRKRDELKTALAASKAASKAPAPRLTPAPKATTPAAGAAPLTRSQEPVMHSAPLRFD